MDNMTLSQYWEMLDKHDWYYDFSDDGRVWARGQAEARKLAAIATESEAHETLLAAFRDHHFSGKPWDTEKKPKPTKPVDA